MKRDREADLKDKTPSVLEKEGRAGKGRLKRRRQKGSRDQRVENQDMAACVLCS